MKRFIVWCLRFSKRRMSFSFFWFSFCDSLKVWVFCLRFWRWLLVCDGTNSVEVPPRLFGSASLRYSFFSIRIYYLVLSAARPSFSDSPSKLEIDDSTKLERADCLGTSFSSSSSSSSYEPDYYAGMLSTRLSGSCSVFSAPGYYDWAIL